MVDENENVVPVWTLATHDVTVPPMPGAEALTDERLEAWRLVLAAMADTPIATLEAHPVPSELDRSRGVSLGAASSLAERLTALISQTSSAGFGGSTGETLFRMVVPAKFAEQVGGGLLNPMASKAGSGVHSALVGPSGIAGHATFKPVVGNLAGDGVFTLAAPLMAAVVAAGVYAEHKNDQAIANITRLLEKLHEDKLESERTALNGCRSAVEKATAILLDEGEIGPAVGIDTTVKTITDAVERARERLKKWQRALSDIGDRPVEIATLRKTFGGIDHEGGEFRAHLQLAELAIELQKRVIVLQAVAQAQKDPSNPFERFVARLKADQEDVMQLESDIADVRRALSRLQLDRSHGIRDVYMHMGDVDHLLRASRRLRELGDGVDAGGGQSDVAIELVRNADGSVVVFPALTA